MSDLLRFFLREPLLGGLVLICVLIVGALWYGGWAEKRRVRLLLKQREALRALKQRQESGPEEAFPLMPLAANRPVFRLFRWEFVILSAAAVLVVMPMAQRSAPVKARESSSSTKKPEKSAARPTQMVRETPPPVVTPAPAQESETLLTLSGAAEPDSLNSGIEPQDSEFMEGEFLGDASDSTFQWDTVREPVSFRTMPDRSATPFQSMDSRLRGRR